MVAKIRNNESDITEFRRRLRRKGVTGTGISDAEIDAIITYKNFAEDKFETKKSMCEWAAENSLPQSSVSAKRRTAHYALSILTLNYGMQQSKYDRRIERNFIKYLLNVSDRIAGDILQDIQKKGRR